MEKTRSLLEEDIVESPDLTPNAGKIAVMSGPGLGFSLNEDAVGRAAEAYSRKNGLAPITTERKR